MDWVRQPTPKKISKIIPTPLVALVILTPLSVFFNFDVQTIGEIPTTLPTIVIPEFSLENYQLIITLVDENQDHLYHHYALQDKQIRVIKINGAFFFGSSTAFESKVDTLLDTRKLIIDIAQASSMRFLSIRP